MEQSQNTLIMTFLPVVCCKRNVYWTKSYSNKYVLIVTWYVGDLKQVQNINTILVAEPILRRLAHADSRNPQK